MGKGVTSSSTRSLVESAQAKSYGAHHRHGWVLPYIVRPGGPRLRASHVVSCCVGRSTPDRGGPMTRLTQTGIGSARSAAASAAGPLHALQTADGISSNEHGLPETQLCVRMGRDFWCPNVEKTFSQLISRLTQGQSPVCPLRAGSNSRAPCLVCLPVSSECCDESRRQRTLESMCAAVIASCTAGRPATHTATITTALSARLRPCDGSP